MTVLNPESYAEILDNIPHVVMRLAYADPVWNVVYVNKAIERYGYSREEFRTGGMTWNDLVHPDDRAVALTLARDYVGKGIVDFKLQYRIVTRGGASIYITEYSHINRGEGGRGIRSIRSCSRISRRNPARLPAATRPRAAIWPSPTFSSPSRTRTTRRRTPSSSFWIAPGRSWTVPARSCSRTVRITRPARWCTSG